MKQVETIEEQIRKEEVKMRGLEEKRTKIVASYLI